MRRRKKGKQKKQRSKSTTIVDFDIDYQMPELDKRVLAASEQSSPGHSVDPNEVEPVDDWRVSVAIVRQAMSGVHREVPTAQARTFRAAIWALDDVRNGLACFGKSEFEMVHKALNQHKWTVFWAMYAPDLIDSFQDAGDATKEDQEEALKEWLAAGPVDEETEAPATKEDGEEQETEAPQESS